MAGAAKAFPVRARIAVGALVALVVLLAALPSLLSDYALSFMLSVMSYLVLTVAWALFTGTTRLVSLATSAFFGVGMYTVAMLINVMPLYATFAAALGGGALLAFVVGVLTLRIAGMFFVIFGFGLSEMIRQLMVWWEINKTHTMSRYVFVSFDATLIHEHLLGLAVLVFFVGWRLRRSRLGLALLVIGKDETVARQVGINMPFAKVTIFVVSAMFITMTGALMAPRPRWRPLCRASTTGRDSHAQVSISGPVTPRGHSSGRPSAAQPSSNRPVTPRGRK